MPSPEEENPSFLENLKHRYLDFVESLKEKGVPAPHILVPLAAIVIILLAVNFAFPGLLVEKKNITLTVKDSVGRALPGATVTLLASDGSTLASKTTDLTGKAALENVPTNANVKVEAEGFTPSTKAIASLLSDPSISLRSARPASRSVSVKIVDGNNQPLENAFVTMSFASGELAPSASSVANGIAQITVQESQIAAGTIDVSLPGYATQQKPFTQDELTSGQPIIITLSPLAAAQRGQFTVRVSSANGAVAGARVTLIDSFTETEQNYEITAQDGSVVFDNISFGSVMLVRVTASGFAPFSREFTFTEQSRELDVSLLPRQAGQGPLTLSVSDTEGGQLQANVNVIEVNSNKLLASGETQNGEFTADLAAGVTAYATIYADGYLPGFTDGLTAGASRSITLERAAAGSVVDLTVQVREDGFPSAGAEVTLYRSGGFLLGLPAQRTDGAGIINFTIPLQFQGNGYRVYAKASKTALNGQSDLQEVTQLPLPLTIDLIALPANVTISLRDISTGAALSSGSVEAQIDGLAVSHCDVDASGICKLGAPAGKEVKLYATAPGYLSFTSSQGGFSAGERANLTLKLYPLSLAQGATVTFLGLFDSNGAKVREVSNAETYKARFAVTMPSNVDNAGFYVRVGDEADSISSTAAITSFDSNGAQFVQSSTTFDSTSASCYSGEPTTSETPLKWVYFSFPRGFVGTREVSVNVKVAAAATAESSVKLIYRAFGFKQGLPLLAPSDTELLNALRNRIDNGERLTVEDTCAGQPFTQEIPLTSQPLKCSEESGAEICYKATLSDGAAVGSPSTFQPTIGRDFTMELEVLTPFAIDSLALRTDAFRVSNARQTLANSEHLSFAESEAASASSREVNVPFVTLPNRKGRVSLTLSPLLVSQNAQVVIVLRSGDKRYEIPLALSIGGTNAFTVTASPQAIPAAHETKVNILVRDRNSNPVSDAIVGFFECDGSPFSASEPGEIQGDNSQGSGANGRYSAKLSPSGLGEIGVRVEGENFKSFEQCLITVEARDFIEVDPESLEFRGSSQDSQPQQVTITNSLNEPIRVSSSINCGTDAVPLAIFPSSFTVEPASDSRVSVRVIPNVTSTAQCIATFNARAGSYRAVRDIPVSVSVNCPNCVATPPAITAAKLPNVVTVFVDPFFLQGRFFLQGSSTIPLALPADPSCKLDGFRITYAGNYLAPGQPFASPLYRQGVLAGLPQPANWYCSSCSAARNGDERTCFQCQAQAPVSAWACGRCTPAVVSDPTVSSRPIIGESTCNACFNSQGAYRSYAGMSPLLYRGAQRPFNPAIVRTGFDTSTGSPYIDDYGSAYDAYSRVGVFPALPGSPLFQGFRGYAYGANRGYARAAIRDALQVEDCSRDGITVSADFSYFQQVVPGTGTLTVTLPDGTRKPINVAVIGPSTSGGIDFAGECGISQSDYSVKVGADYKTTSQLNLQLSCPFSLRLSRISITDKNNKALRGCDEPTLDVNKLNLKCDFNNDEAKKALDESGEIYATITLLSPERPDVTVEVRIRFQLERPTIPAAARGEPEQPLPAPPQPLQPNGTTTAPAPTAPGQIIEKINVTRQFFKPLERPSRITSIFPDYFAKVASSAVLKFDALKDLPTFTAGQLYLRSNFTCKDSSFNLTSRVKITSHQTNGYLLTADGANTREPRNSLLFAYCGDPNGHAVDSASHYLISAEVVQIANNQETVLDTKYWGNRNDDAAVDQAAAGVFEVVYSPEAPRHLPPRIADFAAARFDNCGRLNAPYVSSITVLKKNANQNVYVNSRETLTPGQTLSLDLCFNATKPGLNAGKQMNVTLTYSAKDGSYYSLELGTCSPGQDCTFKFNTDRFLSPQQIVDLNLDLSKPVFLGSSIEGVEGSARYFCKYWPDAGGNSDCTKYKDAPGQNAVPFTVTAQDPLTYSLSPFCRLDPDYLNPNIILCDVDSQGQRSDIPLTTGIHFKTVQNDAQGIRFEPVHPAQGNGDRLLCINDQSYNLFRLRAGEKGKCQSYEPPGEITPLIKVEIINPRVPDGQRYGESGTPTSRSIVRVRINSLFGATEDWFTNYFHYNFDLKRGGRTVYTAKFQTQSLPRGSAREILDSGITDQRQGIYILGPNDVVRLRDGNAGIVQYLGNRQEGFVFSVREKNKATIQDCNGPTVGGVVGGAGIGLVLGAACFIPVSNVFWCPVVVGALGTAGGVIGSAVFQERSDYYLVAKAGETESCDTTHTTPDVFVKPLRKENIEIDGQQKDVGVCVLVSTDANDVQDKAERLRLDPATACRRR